MNKSLVVIDTKVAHYQSLLGGVNPDTEIVIIPTEVDGVEYLTQQTASRIHLVSHGSPGCLYLGNSELNLGNIVTYASQLRTWKVKELVIYGCRVASGEIGEEFINQLHQLTGALIAASSTVMGNSAKGGNWELEVTRGEVNASIAFSPEVAQAYTGILETIVVDILGDEEDGVSLGDAINRANSLPGRDMIFFDESLNGGTITLAVGETLTITDDLTIEGLGADMITIDGNGADVFEINDGLEDNTISVAIANISIVNGNTSIDNQEELTLIESIVSSNRTGIFSSGTLSILDSEIDRNIATGIGINGGTLSLTNSTLSNTTGPTGTGIDSIDATLTITNSTISNSHNGITSNSGTVNLTDSNVINNRFIGITSSAGEVSIANSNVSNNRFNGIFSSGTLSLENSTVLNTIRNNPNVPATGIFNSGTLNLENSRVSGTQGTGIFSRDAVNVTNSTVSGNTGVGIFSRDTISLISSTVSGNSNGGIDSSGTLSLINSTVSGNTAETGGGIAIGIDGRLSVINSTITQNQAEEGQGSGIAAVNAENIEIANSIIAGNVFTDIDFVEGENVFTSLGGNLIGLGNATEVFTGDRDQVAVEDPKLGVLEDNGGPTSTHLPLVDSPAIDTGINDLASSDRDQRGIPRITNSRVDIGAVEFTAEEVSDNIGSDADDTIEGSDGNDTLQGLAGNDSLTVSDGNDSLQGASGDDTLIGGTGDDTLNGGNGVNILVGDSGNDTLISGIGNDNLTGGTGDDTLNGGNGVNILLGDSGNDTLISGIGEDNLTGGTGDDSLNGGGARDVLLGGPGNDTLIGGIGNDNLRGGRGMDRFQFNSVGDGRDNIADFDPMEDLITVFSSGFGGDLLPGVLPEEGFMAVSRFRDLDDSFSLGFVYATETGRLAYIDTMNPAVAMQIPLTAIATLRDQPELAASNIMIV
ncbi:DUF4347 domain-containing protein [Gloeocapsa sp. PCC 73106]|uniref:DUF4347 domain-containing protein n=1 Tax=Gloeocapsa sp. PCC 73106 TaxID=102232 RepID=UPI0002ACB90B|nr:DUF4347 domain-containing protein [Gloeocapsa sp. PCC 73106]ELR96635.1 putative calcium-binding protein [Gloeocapsa sp. PCC 73106]